MTSCGNLWKALRENQVLAIDTINGLSHATLECAAYGDRLDHKRSEFFRQTVNAPPTYCDISPHVNNPLTQRHRTQALGFMKNPIFNDQWEPKNGLTHCLLVSEQYTRTCGTLQRSCSAVFNFAIKQRTKGRHWSNAME